MTKTKRSWVKRLLVIGLILVAIAAGIYWYVATEKFSDTKDTKATFTVNAMDFIKEFEKDDKAANKKYGDQIIVVNGRVAEVEPVDTTINIKFIDTTTSSYIIFAFQEQHLAEAKTVEVGDSVSIKGSCSGGIQSEILGNEAITFKRCTLNK
jgi:hypothetical protein